MANWRKQALEAEIALTDMAAAMHDLEARYQVALDALAGIQKMLDDRPLLISIARHDGKNRFGFTRNKQLYYIECYGTWDDDIKAMRNALLGNDNG